MFVAKWYTRASRVRIVIAKFDGRWKLPGGPYPIPELVAFVGGVLLTLFLLPRTGQPVLTAAVGITATVLAVGVMRKMPYSPVSFGTRVHRVCRLYTHSVSITTSDRYRVASTASTVRPHVELLDAIIADPAPAGGAAISDRRPAAASGAGAREPTGWADMFATPQHSPAAGLFG